MFDKAVINAFVTVRIININAIKYFKQTIFANDYMFIIFTVIIFVNR